MNPMTDERFIDLMAQQTQRSMEEMTRRFVGRYAQTRGAGSRPQVIDEVSLNQHHGVIFRFKEFKEWVHQHQIIFLEMQEKRDD